MLEKSSQTQVIKDPSLTIDPLNPPPVVVETATPQAIYTDGNGNVTQTTLNRGGQEVTTTDELGGTGSIERNEAEAISSTTDGNGNVSNFEYYGLGNLLSASEMVVDADGNSETLTQSYTYDPKYSLPTSVTDQKGDRTLYEIDATGNMLSSTRVIGEWDQEVDLSSNSSNTGGEGHDDIEIEYTYNNAGLVKTETDGLGRVTAYDYDELGRVTQITTALGTAESATIGYEYDAAGNQSAIIDELGNRTEFEYDAANRVTKITEADPDGNGGLTSPVTLFN